MKKLLIITGIIIIIAAFSTFYFYKKSHFLTTYREPNKTLQELKEGNVRFVSGKSVNHDYAKSITDPHGNQHPKAVVLNCMDSINIPEITFDQKVGDLLTLRTAGNTIDKNTVAGMEIAAEKEGATLIVVLGHTDCNTIKLACSNENFGNVTGLLQLIQPAVSMAKANIQNDSCKNPILLSAIIRQNVINVISQITRESPAIAKLVKNGDAKIVGGIYNSATGAVLFIDQPTK